MTNHEEIGRSIGALVAEKNAAYGDSFKNSGEIMKFLFPNGIPPEKYKISLALVRILDKIFRIATNPGYNNEDPWRDIAGYCILMAGYESQNIEHGTPANQVLKRIDEDFIQASKTWAQKRLFEPAVDLNPNIEVAVTEYRDGTTETLYPDGRKVVTKAEITDTSPLGRIKESRYSDNRKKIQDVVESMSRETGGWVSYVVAEPALNDAGIA